MPSAEISDRTTPTGEGETHYNPGEAEKVDELRDPNIVDWDGPDDPANPLNWSATRKATMIGVVSFITFLSPLASTIIAPAAGLVMRDFHTTSSILGSFITSIYLLGYAFGPLVLAPVSELYGRSIVYNVCNVVFLVFNVACAKAPNMGGLLAFRLFAGIAGSSPVTIGAGSIADMIAVENRGLAMTGWIIGPLIGPVVGPIIGGYLAPAKSWRWVFWLLSIVSGAICVVTFALMKESSALIILERKARRARKETGNDKLRSKLHTGRASKELFMLAILRPTKMLFMSPIVFLLSLYTSSIYAYMYLCFTTFPTIFEQQYGFSPSSSSLAYLGIGTGCIFGLLLAGGLSDRMLKALTVKNGGEPKPEYRLPLMIIGGIFVPVGLFWYGWSAQTKTHYIVPIIGTSFLGGGMVIAYMASATYIIDAFKTYAASATAAGTVLRSLLGALLPLAGPPMYSALGVGWGTSVLGFIAVGMVPLPFVFIRYGERIRENKLFKVEW
ncbi:uncharacterized protein A1O9_05920 [Exophiala aquamarina CBS 119918]|uniref:Major facilitator superfamily (MFS) profile domain-containing protein n=1 Tax=Exophiala aquamarina CBS 119918 TaxID=1182545 RepID=A0A072PDZ2_9EURO|nr:uncharacterized protein A1O9_05920 [Exophiala aquamarina CBS 119918]KEF57997.1 hypothetical protein A1O9_05920 [Exophiala aquamarina CBS 119918]